MQIYNHNTYDWNRSVAPHGNMPKVSPDMVAKLCDKHGLPWYTDGWPYASGIYAYCEDDELWREIIKNSKERA